MNPGRQLEALLEGRRVVALTGAGISTESGIPDYRGSGTLRRARNPIRFSEYSKSAGSRRKYWARSVIGWARVAGARPNGGHRALSAMENRGWVSGIITQNVDRLHHRAGSRRVVELHGSLSQVSCLDCGETVDRAQLQQALLDLNPSWIERRARLAPDGDSELADELVQGFEVIDCAACGGALRPDVVFFGESVPRPRVERAYAMLADADVLLVVGSSLAVYSGFRFVRRASELGMPIAIVNIGPTRGDELCSVRVEQRAGPTLSKLAGIDYMNTDSASAM